MIFHTFAKRHKKPDSSLVTESWERNARDCTRKSAYNMEYDKEFFEKVFRLPSGALERRTVPTCRRLAAKEGHHEKDGHAASIPRRTRRDVTSRYHTVYQQKRHRHGCHICRDASRNVAARERTYAQARADISALGSVHIRVGDGGHSQRKPSTNGLPNAKEGAPRRAFPFMPKHERKRKNVSAPLN